MNSYKDPDEQLSNLAEANKSLLEKNDILEKKLKTANRKRIISSLGDAICISVFLAPVVGLFGLVFGSWVYDGMKEDCSYDCATQSAVCVQPTERGSVCKVGGRYFTIPTSE